MLPLLDNTYTYFIKSRSRRIHLIRLILLIIISSYTGVLLAINTKEDEILIISFILIVLGALIIGTLIMWLIKRYFGYYLWKVTIDNDSIRIQRAHSIIRPFDQTYPIDEVAIYWAPRALLIMKLPNRKFTFYQ